MYTEKKWIKQADIYCGERQGNSNSIWYLLALFISSLYTFTDCAKFFIGEKKKLSAIAIL